MIYKFTSKSLFVQSRTNIVMSVFYLVGILTFIPTLLLNMFLTIITSRKWYNRIDDTLILGGLPFQCLTEKLLKTENVKAVVSMNVDYELWLANGRKEWKNEGVSFLQLPISDNLHVPDVEILRKGVEFINCFILKSRLTQTQPRPTVYVHCKAGRTRSATLVSCYLMQNHGWTPEEAVKYLKTKRPHILLIACQWIALTNFYQCFVLNK